MIHCILSLVANGSFVIVGDEASVVVGVLGLSLNVSDGRELR